METHTTVQSSLGSYNDEGRAPRRSATPAVEMEEDVVGLGSYGKTLTVLFTDEDLEPEDECEDDD